MTETTTQVLSWLDCLVASLTTADYRVMSTQIDIANSERATITFEHARVQLRIVVAVSTPPGLASRATVAIHDARRRKIDVEDWLVANGLAGVVRFQAQSTMTAEVFYAAFAQNVARALTGPMGEIVTGLAWSEPPSDWRSLRRNDTF